MRSWLTVRSLLVCFAQASTAWCRNQNFAFNKSIEIDCMSDLTVTDAVVAFQLGRHTADLSRCAARRNSAEHFLQIECAALHSYGPDPHSCAVLCGFLTGHGPVPRG